MSKMGISKLEEFKTEVIIGLEKVEVIYSELKSKAAAAVMESDEDHLQEDALGEECGFISKSVHD